MLIPIEDQLIVCLDPSWTYLYPFEVFDAVIESCQIVAYEIGWIYSMKTERIMKLFDHNRWNKEVHKAVP